MFKNQITKHLGRLPRCFTSIRSQSNALNIEQLEKSSVEVETDEDQRAKELEIEAKRNKSRLNASHRNIVHDNIAYPKPRHWIHGTLSYQRKVYGKYGNKSEFNSSFCWTKQEIQARKEYEAIAHPYTIPEMLEMARTKRREREEEIARQQEEIVKKMAKSEEFKQDLFNRMAKKEAEAKAAKEKKEKLIEEVRRHFGYTVDPRDEKFQEMLVQKEKEQRKATKEARKKAKDEQAIATLLAKNKEKPSGKKETKDEMKEESKEKDD